MLGPGGSTVTEPPVQGYYRCPAFGGKPLLDITGLSAAYRYSADGTVCVAKVYSGAFGTWLADPVSKDVFDSMGV